ncbi:hypothetical protein FV230_09105 [Methylobacterium sp. WL6]|nr:hypothetical protein FV230_09105 [Methylobacterium sp. WL6]
MGRYGDAIEIGAAPSPLCGGGGPRSGSGEGSALSGEVAPLSRPSLTRGPPSPAEGGGKVRLPRRGSEGSRQEEGSGGEAHPPPGSVSLSVPPPFGPMPG